VAARHALHRVAFPAISCGVYGYPPAAAAAVAVRSVREALAKWPSMQVTLCAHDAAMAAILDSALSAA
jgi:O-acetyl-ADP-ribose deacetylase (regulator of RNase III)